MLMTSSPTGLRRLLLYSRMNALRIAIEWQAVVVWGLWIAALVWTGAYVAQHGHNLPANDEWAFIDITYASVSKQVEWIGQPHQEHRFPLSRAVFLGLLWATGHDFRAGMWLSAGLLAGAALMLILAARQLRGRTVLADAVFPILFLHPGHTENLMMGYQIAFTITVFTLGLFALVVARSPDVSTGRSAAWGAGCLIVVANGGWLGLVFTPWIGIWTTLQAYRALRTDRQRGLGWFAAAAVVGAAAYLAWLMWVMLKSQQEGVARAEAMGFVVRARSIAEVIGIGFGPGIATLIDMAAAGWVLLVIQAMTALALLVIGWRARDERRVAWGLLAMLLGVWAFAFGIGYSRGSGLASRYTSFTALGIAVPFLAMARYAPRSTWPLAPIVAAAGVVLLPQNAKHGRYEGATLDERYQRFTADVRSGMPMDVLAGRHVDFWHKTHKGWLRLWEEKFSSIRDVPAPVDFRPAQSADFRRDGKHVEQHVTFDRYRVVVGGEKPVAFIRVTFRAQTMAMWERLMFDWTDPATGEKKRSTVRPWVRPLGPHEVPQEQETVFWIDGRLSEGELIMGRPECRFEVRTIEYVLRDEKLARRRDMESTIGR